MTCNACQSQEFTSVHFDGERFYRCFHCEAIDDYRMAPEIVEPEPPAVEWEPEMVTAPRKPAASVLWYNTQAILQQAERIRAIREELIEELKEAK